MGNSPNIGEAMDSMFTAEDRLAAEERLTNRQARRLADALADGLDDGTVMVRLNQYLEDRAGLERSRGKAERLRHEYETAKAARTKK